MRIRIVTPAAPGSRQGNRVTAQRWARLLRQRGHQVVITCRYRGEPLDAMIALHARKSAGSVRDFRKLHPTKRLVVTLTGTDLYQDLPHSAAAQKSLEIADHLIVLNKIAPQRLPIRLRRKCLVLIQSAEPTAVKKRPPANDFVCVVPAHLRSVKDPFRAAMAARGLPTESRCRVLQIGKALSQRFAERALAEMQRNRRYEWQRERSRSFCRQKMAQSQLIVVSSRLEGGPNSISEAIVDGIPILATRIDGCVGILGDQHPGLFDVGNTQQLRDLMWRAESDHKFLHSLAKANKALRPQINAKTEAKTLELALTK